VAVFLFQTPVHAQRIELLVLEGDEEEEVEMNASGTNNKITKGRECRIVIHPHEFDSLFYSSLPPTHSYKTRQRIHEGMWMPDFEEKEYIFRPNFIQVRTDVSLSSGEVGSCGRFLSQLYLGDIKPDSNNSSSSFVFGLQAEHKLFEELPFMRLLERKIGLVCTQSYEAHEVRTE